ncbi:MAG TPA: hypothetical protein VJ483_05550 [Holophagaceae bacterium]|nr:hypothetical protein [Holophagaceae bacterium]
MRLSPALLLVPCLVLPATAKPKAPSTADLKAQVKKLTKERDELKAKLDNLGDLQSKLAEAEQSRDLAKQQSEAANTELEQLKASLKENAGGSDSILKDLRSARKQLQESQAKADALAKENADLKAKASAAPKEGDLLVLSEAITPAKPLNLYRVTPKTSGWGRPKGVVVVNALVDEKGEVLAVRIIQGLTGDEAKVKEATDACLDAAKRVVFDPARTADGTRVKVWQGVGFNLD